MSLRVGSQPGFSVSTAAQVRDSSPTLVSAIRDGAVQIRKQLDSLTPKQFEKCLLNATSEERGIVLEVLGRYQKEDLTRSARSEPIFVFSASPDEFEKDLSKIVTTLKVLIEHRSEPLTFFQTVLKMTPTMIGLNLWFSEFKGSNAHSIHSTRSEEKSHHYLHRMEQNFSFLRRVECEERRTNVEKEFFKDVCSTEVLTGILLPSIQEEIDAETEFYEIVMSADLTIPGSVKSGVMDSISKAFNRVIDHLNHALSSFFQMFQSKSTPETGALPVLELEDQEYEFDEEKGWVLNGVPENTTGHDVQSTSPSQDWDIEFDENPDDRLYLGLETEYRR